MSETVESILAEARTGLVASAESYVQSRFYPPLPRAYGALLVEAIEVVNECGDGLVQLPDDLNPLPRAAVADVNGTHFVGARELVRILRAEHVLAGE